MRKIICIIILIVPQLLSAQEISLSKDSLLITSRVPNYYTGNREYTYYDSLWIENVGDSLLIIDSIKTEKSYSYRLKIEYSDSVVYSILHNYERAVVLEVLPKDSIEVIFADPDLCPICKTNSFQENFTDKFYLYSNSKKNNMYEIYVSGRGYYMDVNDESPTLDFQLLQNYPNPFNPETTIKYSIPSSNKNVLVTLKIYDILGKKIKTLVNKEQSSGIYEVKFNGAGLASGVYLYKLDAGNFSDSKKFILMK